MTRLQQATAGLVIAAALSHCLTPVLRRVAVRFGIVDRPDGRLKTHATPVPYLGGIAIYLSFVLSLALTIGFRREVLGLVLAGTIVVVLGLIDDLRALRPGMKLGGQVVAVVALLEASGTRALTFLPDWLAWGLAFVWLLAMTNAFNLIDVMDGLAAGVGLVAALVLGGMALANERPVTAGLLAALAGSLVGFLRYNVEPARIYLGDSGSLFLGLMLGALAMNDGYAGLNPVASVAPVVILGLPLFDMAFVTFVRWRRGEPILRGSADHVALRLRRWRFTTRQTVWTGYLGSGVLGTLGVVMTLVDDHTAVAILGGTLLTAVALAVCLQRIDVNGERGR